MITKDYNRKLLDPFMDSMTEDQMAVDTQEKNKDAEEAKSLYLTFPIF